MRSLHKKSLVAGIAAIALVALSGCEMDVKLKVVDENTIKPSVIVAMSEAEKDMLSSMSDGEEVTCQDLADAENEGEATVKDLSSGGDMKCEIILPQEQNLNSSENLKKEGDDLVLFLPKEQIYDLKSELNDAGDMSELGMDSITMNLIIQMPHGIKTATVDGQPVDFKGDTVTLDMTDIVNEVKIVSSPGIPGGNGGDKADSEYDPDTDLTDAGKSVAAGITTFLVGMAIFGILIVAGIVILIVVLVKKSKAKAVPANQFGQGSPSSGNPCNRGNLDNPDNLGSDSQFSQGSPSSDSPVNPGKLSLSLNLVSRDNRDSRFSPTPLLSREPRTSRFNQISLTRPSLVNRSHSGRIPLTKLIRSPDKPTPPRIQIRKTSPNKLREI